MFDCLRLSYTPKRAFFGWRSQATVPKKFLNQQNLRRLGQGSKSIHFRCRVVPLQVAVANPTWITVPCRRTERRQAAREFSLPAHSIATSTPTVVCSRISAGTSSVIGSNTPAHSPQDSMNFLRPGFGSATKICEAQTALTEITVNAPIGPAPEIKTVFPACKPLL